MSIDVVGRRTRKRNASPRIPWWAYAALASLAVATTLFVISTIWNARATGPFWMIVSIIAVNWVVFLGLFWTSRSKPRRRKGSSPKLTA